MRKLKLLAPLTTPDGVVSAGEELVVEEAEAKLLLGAHGLVEDLGEAEDTAKSPPSTEGDGAGGEGGAAGAGAEGEAEGKKGRRR
jgi:hypothetical protein